MKPLIITGKLFQGRLENMLNKILCIVLGHKWSIIERIDGCYAVCKRCLTKKDIYTVTSGTGMEVDPVAVNASKCCKG